jgi:hypothetical protein
MSWQIWVRNSLMKKLIKWFEKQILMEVRLLFLLKNIPSTEGISKYLGMRKKCSKRTITFEGRTMDRNPFGLFTISIYFIKWDMNEFKRSVKPRVIPSLESCESRLVWDEIGQVTLVERDTVWCLSWHERVKRLFPFSLVKTVFYKRKLY